MFDNVTEIILHDVELPIINVGNDEEIAEINRKLAEKEEFENSLPEQLEDITAALCELGNMGAESEVSIEDLMDAVTELAELVSSVLDGE